MIKFLSILLLLFLVCPLPILIAGEAELEWDAPTTNEDGTPIGATLAGYRVYYGTTQRPTVCDNQTFFTYTTMLDVGNVLTIKLLNLPNPPAFQKQKYYFSVTAYNVGALESKYSNEVNKEFIGPTPVPGCPGLRVK